MRKISLENEQKIIQAYQAGYHGYRISSDLGYAPHIVYAVLKRNKISTRSMSEVTRKYPVNEHCLDTIDEEWKAYFLGLFYADGCLTKTQAVISLVAEDKEILEILNNKISPTRPLLICKTHTFIGTNNKKYVARPQHSLNVNNQKLNQRLRELGITERKSLTLQFPTPQIIPQDLMNHFLRGYFDGDGCITQQKWGQRWDIISSYDFCNALKQWLKEYLQIESQIQPTGKVARLTVHQKKDILILFHFLYAQATIYLQRKHSKMQDIISHFDLLKINKPKYSKYTGITFDKRRNRWVSQIKINQRTKFLGSFSTEEEARQAKEKFQQII